MSEEIINTTPSTDVEVTAVATEVTEMPVAAPTDMTPVATEEVATAPEAEVVA